MRSRIVRKFTAPLVFFAGFLMMIFGISFLLGSVEGTSSFSVFFAFLLVVAGAFCAVFAIRLNKRHYYLFFASFFMMSGIFIFLSALDVITLPFSGAWPLLSVFSGLSLLPAGWRRYGAFRPSYIVSSLFFVALGCFLLLFSLKMLPFSFKNFILSWWPLIFILGGLVLVLVSIGAKNTRILPPHDPSREDRGREHKE